MYSWKTYSIMLFKNIDVVVGHDSNVDVEKMLNIKSEYRLLIIII